MQQQGIIVCPWMRKQGWPAHALALAYAAFTWARLSRTPVKSQRLVDCICPFSSMGGARSLAVTRSASACRGRCPRHRARAAASCICSRRCDNLDAASAAMFLSQSGPCSAEAFFMLPVSPELARKPTGLASCISGRPGGSTAPPALWQGLCRRALRR